MQNPQRTGNELRDYLSVPDLGVYSYCVCYERACLVETDLKAQAERPRQTKENKEPRQNGQRSATASVVLRRLTSLCTPAAAIL